MNLRSKNMFVEKWEMEQKDIRKQEIRQTTYSTGIIDGKRIFQIQTYGGAGSTSSAKQIIQFDRDRAIELIRILSSEFGL